MRYFLEIAYKGTHYQGWQKQPEGRPTIQGTIEENLSTILNTPTDIVGCGRTDTGVHALDYYLHVDIDGALPKNFLYRLNKLLPKDITVFRVIPVALDAHARYDATHRAYEYRVLAHKDPFQIDTAYHFPFFHQADQEKIQSAAQLLLEYQEFAPFCKSNHDANTMICQLKEAYWVFEDESWTFHIASNRFLRGMIRLIVGMCLNVGLGKITLEEVKEALDQQTPLKKSLSVDAAGLYLKDIHYPFIQKTDS